MVAAPGDREARTRPGLIYDPAVPPQQRSHIEAHEFAFEAFGVRLLVTADGADELDRVRTLLPPGSQPCSASTVHKRFGIRADSSGAYAVIRGDETYTKNLELDLAFELLEAQVRAYVALHAPDKIFVHAGAVSIGGRAALIPGMSFAGKTTLVAALVRAGAIYYSDEFAVCDERGLVWPYARPLALRNTAGISSPHPVETLGGVAGEDPVPVGVVVVTNYRRDADWKLLRRSTGRGVLALLANTVAAQTRPEQAMRVLTRAIDGATVIESDRGEAGEVVESIFAELEA